MTTMEAKKIVEGIVGNNPHCLTLELFDHCQETCAVGYRIWAQLSPRGEPNGISGSGKSWEEALSNLRAEAYGAPAETPVEEAAADMDSLSADEESPA